MVVRVRPISPADRIDVAPLSDEQGRRRALTLNSRVDRHGRALDELCDVAEGETGTPRASGCGGELLGGVETSNCVVEPDKVRESIPRSRHYPKIAGSDDAKVVGDGIAHCRPIARNVFAQETERRIGELGDGGVAFVVGNVSVHHAP
jgi:hypothetical protein